MSKTRPPSSHCRLPANRAMNAARTEYATQCSATGDNGIVCDIAYPASVTEIRKYEVEGAAKRELNDPHRCVAQCCCWPRYVSNVTGSRPGWG